jgi:hypothetical protein
MLVVLPFCAGDIASTRNLLRWIIDLGPCSQSALLVADAAMQWSVALEFLDLANKAFKGATLISTDEPYTGWPQAPNWMFWYASKHIDHYLKEPFLWLEPDTVPLHKGWLDEIAADYKEGFMGDIYKYDNPHGPFAQIDVMSGIAVYPANAWEIIGGIIEARPDQAWDVSACGPMTNRGTHTGRIQHFFGQKGLPPTFAPTKVNGSPTNTLTLADLRPGASVFHRNKDGTLIALLRQKLLPRSAENSRHNFVVVLPCWAQDAALLVKSLEWMAELGMTKTHDCIVSNENGVARQFLVRAHALANQVFRHVAAYQYSQRQPTFNEAWFAAANLMQRDGRSWLWMEPDCVALRPDWLSMLQTRYDRHGKPFMGPVVAGMGHMNGTGIYPGNTPQRCPLTMHTPMGQAWDMVMRQEMIQDCHDCSGLWHHAWVEREGQLHQHGHGHKPTFPTVESIRRVNPAAVVFHRSSDGTLIDRLREARKL